VSPDSENAPHNSINGVTLLIALALLGALTYAGIRYAPRLWRALRPAKSSKDLTVDDYQSRHVLSRFSAVLKPGGKAYVTGWVHNRGKKPIYNIRLHVDVVQAVDRGLKLGNLGAGQRKEYERYLGQVPVRGRGLYKHYLLQYYQIRRITFELQPTPSAAGADDDGDDEP